MKHWDGSEGQRVLVQGQCPAANLSRIATTVFANGKYVWVYCSITKLLRHDSEHKRNGRVRLIDVWERICSRDATNHAGCGLDSVLLCLL